MKKKRISAVLAVMCVAAMLVGSLAYFTDRVDANVTAKAGELELELSSVTTSKSAELKPGEGVKVDFTLSNKGNKSADVIETLVLSSSTLLSEKNGAAEFELYNEADVTLVDGVATVKAGAQPLSVRTFGGNYTSGGKTYYTVKYVLPEFPLSGTGLGAEVERDGGGNAIGTSKASHYVLVFRADAGNAFQGVSLTMDYEAQAKQHRNTDSTTWDTIEKTQISFAGDNTHMSVLDKNA